MFWARKCIGRLPEDAVPIDGLIWVGNPAVQPKRESVDQPVDPAAAAPLFGEMAVQNLTHQRIDTAARRDDLHLEPAPGRHLLQAVTRESPVVVRRFVKPPLHGGRHDQNAPRSQQSLTLPQIELKVEDVLERLRREDRVHACILEGNWLIRSDFDVELRIFGGGDVGADIAADARAEQVSIRLGAAPKVQHHSVRLRKSDLPKPTMKNAEDDVVMARRIDVDRFDP